VGSRAEPWPTTYSRHISGPHKPSSLIQALSRTMSVFKDISGLENLGKNQGLSTTQNSPEKNNATPKM